MVSVDGAVYEMKYRTQRKWRLCGDLEAAVKALCDSYSWGWEETCSDLRDDLGLLLALKVGDEPIKVPSYGYGSLQIRRVA